jgi:hypothetical protein
MGEIWYFATTIQCKDIYACDLVTANNYKKKTKTKTKSFH